MMPPDFVELINHHAVARQAAGEMPAEARLLAALSGQEADLTPVCLPGFDLYRWADESYSELLAAIARYTEPIHEVYMGYDPIAGLADVPVQQETAGNGDIVRRIAASTGDLTEIVRPSRDGSSQVTRIKWWIDEPDDVERLLSLPWSPSRRQAWAVLDTRARLQSNALTIITLDEPLQAAYNLIGTERLCLWSITERPLLERLLDALHERIMEELCHWLSLGLGPVFRLAGCELAIPPLMALRNYRALAFPYEQAMIEEIHAAGQKAIIHCHGDVSGLLEQFIEAGADGVDPCEPPPFGRISLAEAKRRVGDRLCLWGNIEYGLLAEASEDEVARAVQEAIEAGAPGGRFVLLPSCRLYESPLPDQTRRNLLKFIQAGRAYGQSLISQNAGQ